MKRMYSSVALLALIASSEAPAAEKTAKSPKEALQAFNELIGSWKGTGTMEARKKDFWTETIAYEWQFKEDDSWIGLIFTNGRYFSKGTLRYLPDKELFRLALETTGKESVTFEGPFKERVLTLERVEDKKKETQRLVFTLLHEARFLYRYEVKPEERTGFGKVYQVGLTKEGVAFAGPADTRPVCIVTGGVGTIKYAYKGKDYFFCCTGCRNAFKEDPEKFLKEAAAKKK